MQTVLLWLASLRWRHNGCNSVSNHQPHHCLLNLLFRRRSKKTSKLRVTGLCAGNSPGTGEFPAQMASYAENVSTWWRHHVCCGCIISCYWIRVINLSMFSAWLIHWHWVDSSTVPLHSPNGRHFACPSGCAKGLSLGSEKRWEFPLITWAQNAMGH